MQTPIKKIIALVGFILSTYSMFAQDFTYNGINYTVISETEKTCRTKAGYGSNPGNNISTVDLSLPEKAIYNNVEYTLIEIGEYSFYENRGLKGSLTIPNTVQTIGEGAFRECYGFTGSLTIPNSVQTIGNIAFYNCTGFTGSLTIGNSVQTIGIAAFWNCNGFTGSLIIPNSVQTIEEEAFQSCRGFTGSLTIGNSVQTIGNYAFQSCSGFTGSLTIPNSVQTIGYWAFSGCSGFTGSLTIGDGVETIGGGAFYQCYGFTGSLTIPDSVQTIGELAFQECYGFTGSLTIGNSVQTIGVSAFYGCRGFTGSLAIPNSVQTIGYWAFSGCSGFTGSLTIPSSVKTIENAAFSNCSGFTGSLTIPNSVQTIGARAFLNCSGFTSLTIGENVNTIGIENDGNAFEYCLGLEYITCLAKIPPKAYYKNFSDENYQRPLYVPAESINAYKTAFDWRNFQYINPIQIEATEITLNKTELSLSIGQEETLIATLTPEDSSIEIVWSVETGGENIISVSQDGKVTALSVGTATVIATAGSVSATCKVTVNPIPATGIELNVEDMTLLVGQTDKLKATVTPPNTTVQSVTWKSDNEAVATVDSDGTVTGVSVGVALITATCGEASATCKVTVNPITATGIELNVEDMTLLVGQTDQLKATVTPPNTTDQSVIWKSDNEAVATVSADGKVVGISEGTATITASCGEVSATCKVTVVQPASIYGTAETPDQLLRKGDGTSCTFIAMMPISDSQMESQGYKLVYGYDNPMATLVLDNTTLRYTHTTSAIYNDPTNDFWVFAYYLDGNGDLCVSYRRHLDGRVDDDFDPLALISSPVRSIEDEIIGIYTIEGRYVGKDIDSLGHGVYIVKTTMSSTKIVK